MVLSLNHVTGKCTSKPCLIVGIFLQAKEELERKYSNVEDDLKVSVSCSIFMLACCYLSVSW